MDNITLNKKIERERMRKKEGKNQYFNLNIMRY